MLLLSVHVQKQQVIMPLLLVVQLVDLRLLLTNMVPQ